MQVDGWRLLGDVGGTNARFALHDPQSRTLDRGRTLTAAEYPDIVAAIRAYLEAAGSPGIVEACFAVAAPVKEDQIDFTNSPWRFSRSDLARRLRIERLLTVNDFEALALGVPHIPQSGLHQLRDGQIERAAPKAIIGPGTGLGVSGLIPCRHRDGSAHWTALSGEGGHVSFAPVNELEAELLRFLSRKFDRVSNERLLCGEGLSNLYEFFAARAGSPDQRLLPAEITARGLDRSDPAAHDALQMFCNVLGSAAGDLALTLGAQGGVYIGGGIVPRLLRVLADSDFTRRFLAKGRMGKVLIPIPIYVIVDATAALLGAAAALQEN
jgi:glucokinase